MVQVPARRVVKVCAPEFTEQMPEELAWTPYTMAMPACTAASVVASGRIEWVPPFDQVRVGVVCAGNVMVWLALLIVTLRSTLVAAAQLVVATVVARTVHGLGTVVAATVLKVVVVAAPFLVQVPVVSEE